MKFLMVIFILISNDNDFSDEFFDIDNKSHMLDICVNAKLFD